MITYTPPHFTHTHTHTHTPPTYTPSQATVPTPLPLTLEQVRWFYQEPGKFWLPFSGPDSLSLEQSYSKCVGGDLTSERAGLVQVMGDLYEVNILERMCRHIYWSGEQRSEYNLFRWLFSYVWHFRIFRIVEHDTKIVSTAKGFLSCTNIYSLYKHFHTVYSLIFCTKNWL